MFTESYKKDNEKIELSEAFIKSLAQEMKEENEEIKKQPITSFDTETEFQANHSRYHHNLRTVLCASLVLVCIATIGTVTGYSGKSNSSTTDSALQEESMMDDMVTSEGTSAYDSASTTTGSDEYDSDTYKESALESASSTESEEETLGSVASDSDNGSTDSETADTAATTIDGMDAKETSPSINFSEYEEFVPTDATTLIQQITTLKTQLRGTDMVQLDYADSSRVILHDSWGLLVYDLASKSLIRTFDFTSIASNNTQGDNAVQVHVYSEGNYILLENEWPDRLDEATCYIYNIQTDELIALTYTQLDALVQPEFASITECDKHAFSDYLTNVTDDTPACTIDNTTDLALFYQSLDDTSIASLSLLVLSKDQGETSSTLLPIFGEDSIQELKADGYQMDGYQTDSTDQ